MRLTLQPTKTFFVPEDPDNASVDVELLSMDAIAQIEAKASETGITAQGEASVTLDTYRRVNLTVQQCVKGWNGFYDESGKEISFSRKNINKLARFAVKIEKDTVRLFDWIDKCHTELLDIHTSEEEAVEKN